MLWRATATTSAMARDRPSSVTSDGFVMAPKAKAPEWLLTTPAPSSCNPALFRARDDRTRGHCGRQPAPHHELGVPDVSLEAPVEDPVAPADVCHPPRAVPSRRSFDTREDVGIARHRL